MGFEDPLLFKTTHNPQGFTIASSDSMLPRVENRTHLNDVITRQAVEITGAVYSTLNNIESVCDDLLQVVPDSCFSLTNKRMLPIPEACPTLVGSASRTAMENLMTMA